MRYLRQVIISGVFIALIAVLSFSTGLAQIPRVDEPTVLSTSVDTAQPQCPNVNITANIAVPDNPIGNGVDIDTLNINSVYLLDTSTNLKVTAVYNTTGGNDAFTMAATTFLKESTVYEFYVNGPLSTVKLKDIGGRDFLPYSMSFTTLSNDDLDECGLSNFRFVRYQNALPQAQDGKYATLKIGPDNRLYGTMTLGNDDTGTPSGTIRIFDINGDGSLVLDEQLNFFAGKALIGLAFDPQSTYNPISNPSGNLIAWVVVNNSLNYQTNPEHPEAFPFSGMIYKLTGTSINTGSENWTPSQQIIGLPRSRKDHLVNSLEFGPDGALYVNVGSMSAMGRDDSAWFLQPEVLLAGAVLRVDTNLLSQQPLPLNAATGKALVSDPLKVDPAFNYALNSVPAGYYDPRAANAPLTIFATGVRNAYDLAWHSNGQLYVPTNGSAAGGRTPAYVNNPACSNRINGQPYNGSTTVPSTFNGPLQKDFIFRVVEGGYYGHPNPKRCEWVINGGNPTGGDDPAQFNGYAVGVQPDPNWRGFAHDFGTNASPNGVIEYHTNVYEGALRNSLLVVRYSNGKDIVALKLDGSFDIDQDEVLSVSVENVGASNTLVTLSNPLDIIEDQSNGNLYVSEYQTENSGLNGTINLLKPKNPNAAPLSTDDLYTVNQGDTLIVDAPGILANDSDLNGDSMTAIATTTLPLGLSLNDNGSISYTPGESFTGSVNFSYRAQDSFGANGSIAQVTINVLPDGVTPTQTPTETATSTFFSTETPTHTTTPPTATNTLDPLTPTQTPDPLTPTQTPDPLTPTATLTPTDNLVLNGGFEAKDADLETDLFPWKVTRGTREVIKCNKTNRPDKPDKIFSFEGNCAFQFRSSIGENSKLQQNLDAALTVASDTLTLRFYAKGKNVVQDSADAQIKIKYTDGSKDKIKIVLPAGEYEYQEFADQKLLALDADKLKLQFRYRSTAGKLWIDGVVVIVNDTSVILPGDSGEPLPLPLPGN